MAQYKPPKRGQTYQYRPGDSPAELAKRYGTTPEAVINANPGAYPFNTGQTIKLPYQGNTVSGGVPFGYQGVPQGQALPGFAPQSNAIAQQMTNSLGQTWMSNPFRDYNYMDPAKVRQRFLNSPSQAKDPLGFLFPKEGEAQATSSGANQSSLPNLQFGTAKSEHYQTDPSVAINGQDVGQPVGEQVINGKKFVVDDQGQRIDPTTGQVAWSPKTATTDIYGGQFRYAGQTKFMRNAKGNIKKYYLGKDNKWHIIKQRGGGGGGTTTTTSSSGSAQPAPITQVGLVNFNAGAG